MTFHLRTFVDFFALSAFLALAFALIGAPIKLLLRAMGCTIGRVAPSPLLGMAVVMVLVWYWGGPQGGAKPMLQVLIVASAIGCVAWFAFVAAVPARRRSVLDARHDVLVRRSAGMALVCFVGVGAVLTFTETQLFTRDNFTVITGGNNDAPSYAYLGQHVLDDGPDVPGNIAGFDAGVRSEGFAFGSYAVLAGSAAFTGFDVWRVMQTTLFLALVLGAYALAHLLREVLGDEHAIGAAVCATAGYSVLYVTYLVVQWFFAQLIAIAIVFAVLAVLFRAVRAATMRDRVAGIAVVGVLISGGLAIYPHMTIAGTATLLPLVAIDGRSVRGFVDRGVRTALLFGGGAVLAAGIAPGLVSNAVEVSRELADVEAGWPLPSIYPSELLGFQTSVLAGQGTGTVVTSVLILAAVALALGIACRRGGSERALPLLLGIVCVYATYIVVYDREGGPTYRQWKWITFFTPLFVSAICASVVLICSLLPSPDRWLRRAYALIGGYAVIATLFSTGTAFPLRSPNDYLAVTLDEINLRFDDRLREVPALHVDATPYWETMWLAYFLRDTPVTLGAISYYPPAAATGPWSLQRVGTPSVAGGEVVALNDSYVLVRAG